MTTEHRPYIYRNRTTFGLRQGQLYQHHKRTASARIQSKTRIRDSASFETATQWAAQIQIRKYLYEVSQYLPLCLSALQLYSLIFSSVPSFCTSSKVGVLSTVSTSALWALAPLDLGTLLQELHKRTVHPLALYGSAQFTLWLVWLWLRCASTCYTMRSSTVWGTMRRWWSRTLRRCWRQSSFIALDVTIVGTWLMTRWWTLRESRCQRCCIMYLYQGAMEERSADRFIRLEKRRNRRDWPLCRRWKRYH